MKPDDLRLLAGALGEADARLVEQLGREVEDERYRREHPVDHGALLADLIAGSERIARTPAQRLPDHVRFLEGRLAATKARARRKEIAKLAAAGKLVPSPKTEPACQARGCTRRAARAGLACERCWHLIPTNAREALLRPAITQELKDIHREIRRAVVRAYLRPPR